jgi:hypothetical protein
MTTLALAVREPEPPAAPPLPPPLDSLIVSSLPPLLAGFRRKQFVLLWRGGQDGFGASDFHGRCDRHANTPTVMLDMDGNVFGGFTPIQWESGWKYKWDDILKNCPFMLKNPHTILARKFVLMAEKKQYAFYCYFSCDPDFNDMIFSDDRDANISNFTSVGDVQTNNTGLDDKKVFRGSEHFQVREIQVFEITD